MNKKLSTIEKEKKLLEKLEKTKKDLAKLKKKRLLECGELVTKHGLDQYENDLLDNAFAKLAAELGKSS